MVYCAAQINVGTLGDVMNLDDAKYLAMELLVFWECKGWVFTWNDSETMFGRVTALEKQGSLHNKELHLSSYLVLRNSRKVVREVILHEIAHIKAGLETGHGLNWEYWCNKLEIDPNVNGVSEPCVT